MGFFNSNSQSFPWKDISSLNQLNELLEREKQFILFKHSTRCNISSMVKSRFEREFNQNSNINCYLIDLLKYREISNKVEEITQITHQSPQIFLIQEQTVSYTETHGNIDTDKINKLLS